jgi:hypothetical protein
LAKVVEGTPQVKTYEVSNAYENHEVGFHRSFAPGCVTPAYRELPGIVGNCGLYVRPPGGHAGSACRKVSLGTRIRSDCRAFQSRCACGALHSGGTEIKIDDQEYLILREDEVLGVLEAAKHAAGGKK